MSKRDFRRNVTIYRDTHDTWVAVFGHFRPRNATKKQRAKKKDRSHGPFSWANALHSLALVISPTIVRSGRHN